MLNTQCDFKDLIFGGKEQTDLPDLQYILATHQAG